MKWSHRTRHQWHTAYIIRPTPHACGRTTLEMVNLCCRCGGSFYLWEHAGWSMAPDTGCLTDGELASSPPDQELLDFLR